MLASGILLPMNAIPLRTLVLLNPKEFAYMKLMLEYPRPNLELGLTRNSPEMSFLGFTSSVTTSSNSWLPWSTRIMHVGVSVVLIDFALLIFDSLRLPNYKLLCRKLSLWFT